MPPRRRAPRRAPTPREPVGSSGAAAHSPNRTRHDALGGLAHIGTGNNFTGAGLGVRYRRWLSQDLATDFSAGADLLGERLKAPCPWFEVGFSAADVVNISVRGEYWTREVYTRDFTFEERKFMSWHVGAKGGSYLAAGGVVAGAIAYAVLIAIIVSNSN